MLPLVSNMDSEEDSDHYEDHYTDNTSTCNEEMDDHVELDTGNSSPSMDMVEHHSEYDYDDTMYHYIEQGDHMNEKHAKDYHDYMSCDDDSTMLKFPTLENVPTYYGSSSTSLRHHEDHLRHTYSSSSWRHTKSDKGRHVDHHQIG